jgi:hypothetical protein
MTELEVSSSCTGSARHSSCQRLFVNVSFKSLIQLQKAYGSHVYSRNVVSSFLYEILYGRLSSSSEPGNDALGALFADD